MSGAPAGGAADRGEAATYRIRLRNYVAPFRIGAYAHERLQAQRVRINVELELAWTAAGDDLARVFSYDELLSGIERLREGEHINLIETLADRVAALGMAHPAVRRVRAEVEKLDVFAAAESIGVTVERTRPS